MSVSKAHGCLEVASELIEDWKRENPERELIDQAGSSGYEVEVQWV
jgi:hypothetical protein